MVKEYEVVSGTTLILDNLRHIKWELGNKSPSGFRLAREAHQLLLRSMVEALRGSANLSVARQRKKRKPDCRVWYTLGNAPTKMIEMCKVEGCKMAWRYTDPVEMPLPTEIRKQLNKQDAKADHDLVEHFLDDLHLIVFYELLAKIQTECHMRRYVDSKAVEVTDSEMVLLEWLHENIRNKFEHFIPMTYYVHTRDCFRAALLCLNLANRLLFTSGNVIYYGTMKERTAIASILKSAAKDIQKRFLNDS